jgi:hypothetical protein
MFETIANTEQPKSPTGEKTRRQWSFLHPWTWFGYGSGPSAVAPWAKAQLGSGSIEGKNPYSPVYPGVAAGGIGVLGPGTVMANGRPMPQSIAIYRAMSKYPTLRLAKYAITLAILAAEWMVEIDEELLEQPDKPEPEKPADKPDDKPPVEASDPIDPTEPEQDEQPEIPTLPADPVAMFAKEIIERELVERRVSLMRDCLRALEYGFQSFEPVAGEKIAKDGQPYLGWTKIKALLPEGVDIVTDPHGNLVAITADGIRLDKGEFVHLAYEIEGDNWFGQSRHESAYRDWTNALQTEDELMAGVRKGVGKSVHVGVMPDEVGSDGLPLLYGTDGKTPKNLADGKEIARAVANGLPVSYYRSGIAAHEISNDPKLADAETTKVEIFDGGNPGPTITAGITVCERFDKKLVRAWLRPERSLLEATTAGSRADAESHGDMSTMDAEATHEWIVDELNAQLVDPLVRENCGEQYVGKIKLVAVPIADEQRAMMAKLFDVLMGDGNVVGKFAEALGDKGMQHLIEKLGLKLTFEKPIDLTPEPPPPMPFGPDGKIGDPDPDAPEDDDAAKELSAVMSLSNA